MASQWIGSNDPTVRRIAQLEDKINRMEVVQKALEKYLQEGIDLHLKRRRIEEDDDISVII